MRRLRNSISKIHFSVDVWSSPTRTNLQAICCHFLDEKTRKVTKACLALANHPEQYRAEEQADAFLRVIKEYNISHNRIGAFVSDNHGSNDKMIRILKKDIEELPPVEHIRVRCLGHVINLAASAFIYKQNNEADELSKPLLPTQGKKKDKDEIKAPSEWRKLGPVGKLFNLVKLIHASNANINSFTNITGCQMPLPNATRWNSWFIMIHKALKLRKGIIQWSTSRKSAQEDCLTHDEWRELFNYKNFLLPFWQATKAAEGDRASLQSVQISMDYLADHYAKATEFYKDNASTKARILTSHITFDKYYSIADRAPLYAASILLHPSLRRSYLDKQWSALSTKNETPYTENAVKATTSLWEKYKPKDGEAKGRSKPGELSSFDVFMQSVLQDNSSCDEFERFIQVCSLISPAFIGINKNRAISSPSIALHSSGGLNPHRETCTQTFNNSPLTSLRFPLCPRSLSDFSQAGEGPSHGHGVASPRLQLRCSSASSTGSRTAWTSQLRVKRMRISSSRHPRSLHRWKQIGTS